MHRLPLSVPLSNAYGANADQCSNLLATDAAELGQERDQRTGQQRSHSRHGGEQPVTVGEHGIACNDLDHALVEQIDIASKSANSTLRKTPQHRIFQQSGGILGSDFLTVASEGSQPISTCSTGIWPRL